MTRTGDWIQTFSGMKYYPCDPRPEDILIVDIAHALSNQCRFTGHCSSFYSVAEHCVHVSRACDPQDALWGLLHDASEAYLCDLARPIKKYSELGRIYSEMEDLNMIVICDRYGISRDQPDSVESADKRMLWVEASSLMGPLGPEWDKWKERVRGDEPTLELWHPKQAKQQFLRRFAELTNHEQQLSN